MQHCALSRNHRSLWTIAYIMTVTSLSAVLVGYVLCDAGLRQPMPFTCMFLSLFFLLLSTLLPGCEYLADKISVFFVKQPAHAWIFPVLPLTLYLLTMVTQDQFWGTHLLYFSVYILVPFLLVKLSARAAPAIQYASGIAAAASLWIPFDHRWYGSFWPGRFPFSYNFISLIVVLMIVFLFLLIRGQSDMGYRLIPRWQDFPLIFILTLAIAVLIIPAGVFSGFLRFRSTIRFNPDDLLIFAGIFLTIGLVEEIVFRGVVQRYLEIIFKSHWPALFTASVLFGLTHWNNAAPGFAVHYIIFASIAGIFYGIAYKKSGSLFPAIFLHALVDLIWLVLFVK